MSLKIKEVSKTYGKNIILDNVSINIEPQKFMAYWEITERVKALY